MYNDNGGCGFLSLAQEVHVNSYVHMHYFAIV